VQEKGDVVDVHGIFLENDERGDARIAASLVIEARSRRLHGA